MGLVLAAALAAQLALPSLAPAEQEAALALALQLFTAKSVDAAKVKEVESLLQRRREAGEFSKPQALAAFCDKLQSDLQTVTHDPHGMVAPRAQARPIADPARPPEPLQQAEAGEARQRQQMVADGGAQNFGFVKVERLDGNIGYLRLDGCYPGCGEALASALGFLSRTKALIIDLRENGGGDPDAGMQMARCFVDKGSQLLATERHRNGRVVEWRTPEKAAARYLDLPVFVLMSSRTFSAAEALAYDLQALKVATIVGERTRGGAGTVTGYRIHPNILMGITVSECRSDITDESFQGIGVKPDLPCKADAALNVAHVRALEQALTRSPTDPEREELQQTLDALKAAK